MRYPKSVIKYTESVINTESVIKYTLTLLIGHYCPFSLYNRSSISATAGMTSGTAFLEIHVECSAFVSELQGYPGNSTLITAISFLNTTRNHRGPN
jgi:hypothetical protein